MNTIEIALVQRVRRKGAKLGSSVPFAQIFWPSSGSGGGIPLSRF